VFFDTHEKACGKMMICCLRKEGPWRPKAKALGYQPLVFGGFFVGLSKALRLIPKSKTLTFSAACKGVPFRLEYILPR
jgi:hypothetical protein